MSQINTTYAMLAQKYRDITDNFWSLYMPVFQSQSDTYSVWERYFNSASNEPLKPQEKPKLADTLRQMMLLDSNVQWIVIYDKDREDNYILYNDNSSLTLLPEDFPYLDELNSDSRKMELYGMETLSNSSNTLATFAICGGIPSGLGEGKILAGYRISSLQTICDNNSYDLESLNYVLTNNNEIVFDYNGHYDRNITYCSESAYTGILESSTGEKLFVHSEVCGRSTSLLTYYASWQEIFLYCHGNTPFLILVFLIFFIFSIIIYLVMMHRIKKEVAVINKGLQIIGENDLDYRIPITFHQNGLPEIAHSINRMAFRLKENINKSYYYELKQREAELSELQSKFNPHFLYNSLEMLRSRCQLNGDNKTAALIVQLSAIFRGFIDSRNFIPMTEELTFSKRYLALFGARYEDKVKIRYDFDKDILQYGIIRNIFQPLIENYFVHGFDTSNDENYILFKGKSLDENTMILTAEDNGNGLTDEEIRQLNERLHEPIKISTESYGLKNLHQRLQLFYGESFGLTIYKNPNSPKGLCIQMTALKMTCNEYESQKRGLL
ncbi:MAG: histidine kinase [Lachnospiraceae bacterium]|nr:histidine kinase [Lachnospiraceae bacterium]